MTTPATTPADFIEQQDARFAIDGAIAYGRMGIKEPPAGHWLTEYWHVGRQFAKLGETSALDNQTPLATPSPGKAPEPVAWRHEIVEPTGQHLTLYSASADNPWSHWLGQYRDECRYTAMPLYASPGKADAEDAARYRRIRNGPHSDRHGDVYAMVFMPDGDEPIHGAKLDSIIDAAIKWDKQ